MTRIILIGAIVLLLLFAVRFFKLLSNFKSGSRPNIDDLKDRATYLKNKYKNVQEADYRDITHNDNENGSSKTGNG